MLHDINWFFLYRCDLSSSLLFEQVILSIKLIETHYNGNYQLLGKTFLWKMIKLLQNIYGLM